jgi:hypothetical protein
MFTAGGFNIGIAQVIPVKVYLLKIEAIGIVFDNGYQPVVFKMFPDKRGRHFLPPAASVPPTQGIGCQNAEIIL